MELIENLTPIVPRRLGRVNFVESENVPMNRMFFSHARNPTDHVVEDARSRE